MGTSLAAENQSRNAIPPAFARRQGHMLANIIHRVFSHAQLDVEIQDRFGNPVKPREWFLVPYFVVDELVEHIKDGTITQFVYDRATARLVRMHIGE